MATATFRTLARRLRTPDLFGFFKRGSLREAGGRSFAALDEN
jgi:hypothetical protein